MNIKLKNKTFVQIIILTCTFIFIVNCTFGQLKIDAKAEEQFNHGINYLEEENYNKAAKYFYQITKRKFNRLTTVSYYLAGLSYYYDNDDDLAMRMFQKLITTYPKSKYIDETTYHKALIMLKKEYNKDGGLYLLTTLIENAADQELKDNALNAYQNYLFYQTDTTFLTNYLTYSKSTFRNYIMEALCFQLYLYGKFTSMHQHLKQYKVLYGDLSYRLKKISNEAVVPKLEPLNLLNIAVVMPFGPLPDSTSSLNTVSTWSIETLAGMKIATELIEFDHPVQLNIHVFDTKKSNYVTNKIIENQLEELQPDIIIGELFNEPSKILSEYAEKNEIIQFIPYSPVDQLVSNKKYTYLFNPSTGSQINKLADYIVNQQGINKILILGDNSKFSKIQIDKMSEELLQLEAKFTVENLSDNYEYEYRLLKGYLSDYRALGYEAVYLATNNEALVSFVLKTIKDDRIQTKIFGSPEWSKFKYIDKLLFSSYDATFCDSYYEGNDKELFHTFSTAYEKEYNTSPSIYSTQGFDIIQYIGNNLNTNKANLKSALEIAKPFKGLNQNYYFNKAQDNQSIQFLKFTTDGLVKINTWKKKKD